MAKSITDAGLGSDASLRGYWKLEDATDDGPNGYDLTNNNSVTFSAGKFDNAGNFNGSNQYLSIADASCPDLRQTGSFTVSAWINADSFSNWQKIAGKRNEGTGANGWEIGTDANKKVAVVGMGLSTNNLIADVVLDTGTWYHVAGVHDSSAQLLKIYVDGVKKETSSSGSLTNPSTPFTIGCNYTNGSTPQYYFDGKIDDVAVFNRALTDEEIQSLALITANKYENTTVTEYVNTHIPTLHILSYDVSSVTDATTAVPFVSAYTYDIASVTDHADILIPTIHAYQYDTTTITEDTTAYPVFPLVESTRYALARGCVIPSQPFLNEVNKTVRSLSGKLEILWDGASWTDESTYLLSARANEEIGNESGEGVSTTLDVELDNTSNRFTPEYTDSPIYAYIKPRVRIKISVTMGGYTYLLFTGYIKNIHPNIKSGTCSLECYDNQVKVSNKETNGSVYENYRSDELLEVLATLAGMTPDEWDFDEGHHVINYGYFDRRYVWPLMGEIASAERGRVFFDRDGKLKFWNRERLHNKIPNITLTRNDWITNLDYSVAEHQIKNSVTVQAAPRSAAGIQVVWTNGNIQYLDQYSETLVYIPAGGTQTAFLDLEDPCSTFITPVANTDYTANSTIDGTGDDLTSNISIASFINYGNAVQITVANTGGVDAYLTKFQLRGNPVRVLNYIRVKATDSPSISSYGEQTIEIQNDFVQTEDAALQIAYEELWRRQDAINNFDMEIIGIPHLRCGDVVSVEHDTGKFKNYMIKSLDWMLDDGGFTQKLRMVNPYLFPSISRVDARANIVS